MGVKNLVLTLVLCLLGGTNPPTIPTPSYLYSVADDGYVYYFECSNWRVLDNGKTLFDAKVRRFEHIEWLKWAFTRPEFCNLIDFNVLAQNWRPPVHTFVPPPETPQPPPPLAVVIHYFKSPKSMTYHLPNCRYVNALMVRIDEPLDPLLVPCKVCKPDKIESILNCFLPENNQ